ncbi:MAG: GGDEF domain-containing protein [Treponema sp.]|nr:GGDEF domain-containing protein [Treponema sp.]
MKNNLTEVLSMALAASSKETPLFSGLSEEEFSIAAGALKPIHAKKDDPIFREGDTGEALFILLSGSLRAFGTQSDGTQRWLFNIEPGGFFGEMSIIAHEPRSATICAAVDSVVMMLSAVDFYKIINDHPAVGYKILRAISAVQNEWLDQSAKSYSDIIRWGETARRRAITDEMTGLYNRRFLEESIKERFSNSSMNFRTMSLLMMDLDKIHGINDRHGTKAGDLIITSSADIIRSCLRPGDIPARLSGDEFAVLLPDTDKIDAARVAERIRENIANRQVEVPAAPGAVENVMISTRTSIGIALAPVHANTTEDLLEISDTALRKAKDLGRNRVEVFA